MPKITRPVTQNLKILHQNIASIISKKEILELTLQELQEEHNDPDIICLSETFIKRDYESYIKIHGYEMASNYCREKQRGGTCILAKKNLLFKDLPFIKSYATQNTFEVCGIELTHQKIIIICVYRTPQSDPNQFLIKLNSLMHNLLKQYKSRMKVVLAGDFNINTLKKGNITTQLQDLAHNYNLIFHIDVPTRKSSCIDHILSNIHDATAAVLPLHLSDHDTAQMLTIPLKHKIQNQAIYYTYKRDYSSDNIHKFKECLSNLSWSEIHTANNANAAFNHFHETFCLLYNLCFPKLKVKVNFNNKKKQSWISKGLKKSCKTKRLLRHQFYRNKTANNKTKYLRYTNLLKKCIFNSKKNANIKYIAKNDNKCKATWNVIKDELNNANSRHNIDSIKYKNTLLTNPVEIASAFNNHYIDSTNRSVPPNVTGNSMNNVTVGSMFLKPMSITEVKKEILLLNNTNSEGYDEINTKIIKTCVDEIVEVLTQLINLSFYEGIFPEALKLSVVRPLYKKGDRLDLNNYRPITLIPILSKIYEKCMYKRIENYCTKFNIINKEQHGFQKGKSTTLAIYALINVILTNINDNNLTTGLFFDLSKAFDLVSHDLLLQKLEAIGIRGPTLQWIKSYLDNRQQCVTITNINEDKEVTLHSSKYKCNKFGVPQGSILGPILFLIYINDIIKITKHKCILFADDISIIVTSDKKYNTIYDHETDINNTIDILINWLYIHNLKLNLDKSVYIQFNKSNNHKFNLKLSIPKIKSVTHTKFLGVTIDEDLHWKVHVDNVSRKINKFVYALRQVKKSTNLKTAILAYHAYVESLLRYGLIIWGNSTDQNRTFVAQKKCIRALYGLQPDESCQPVFKKLGLLPLPCLYINEMCMFVWKHKELFKIANDTNPRSRRDPYRLVLNSAPRLAKYNKSCLSMCVRIYNKLPIDLKMLNSRYTFKNKLCEWLINNNFYSIKQFLEHK